MATSNRSDDPNHRRQILQRLAIAAGMTLSDGSPIVIGGPKCPSVSRIKDAIGFDARRMTKDQFSDAHDDYGAVRPYLSPTHQAGSEVGALLDEWSGTTDCDGEMPVWQYLQIAG